MFRRGQTSFTDRLLYSSVSFQSARNHHFNVLIFCQILSHVATHLPPPFSYSSH